MQATGHCPLWHPKDILFQQPLCEWWLFLSIQSKELQARFRIYIIQIQCYWKGKGQRLKSHWLSNFEWCEICHICAFDRHLRDSWLKRHTEVVASFFVVFVRTCLGIKPTTTQSQSEHWVSSEYVSPNSMAPMLNLDHRSDPFRMNLHLKPVSSTQVLEIK